MTKTCGEPSSSDLPVSGESTRFFDWYIGCGLGPGLEGTEFCFRRRRKRKTARAASTNTITPTGTPAAGPIMDPRCFDVGGDVVVAAEAGTAAAMLDVEVMKVVTPSVPSVVPSVITVVRTLILGLLEVCALLLEAAKVVVVGNVMDRKVGVKLLEFETELVVGVFNVFVDVDMDVDELAGALPMGSAFKGNLSVEVLQHPTSGRLESQQ